MTSPGVYFSKMRGFGDCGDYYLPYGRKKMFCQRELARIKQKWQEIDRRVTGEWQESDRRLSILIFFTWKWWLRLKLTRKWSNRNQQKRMECILTRWWEHIEQEWAGVGTKRGEAEVKPEWAAAGVKRLAINNWTKITWKWTSIRHFCLTITLEYDVKNKSKSEALLWTKR